MGTFLVLLLILYHLVSCCHLHCCQFYKLGVPLPYVSCILLTRPHSSEYIFQSMCQGASRLVSHPSRLFVLHPFLLLSLCVRPKSSPLRSLLQGTYTSLRSVSNVLPTSIGILPDSPYYLRFIQLPRAFLRSLSLSNIS